MEAGTAAAERQRTQFQRVSLIARPSASKRRSARVACIARSRPGSLARLAISVAVAGSEVRAAKTRGRMSWRWRVPRGGGACGTARATAARRLSSIFCHAASAQQSRPVRFSGGGIHRLKPILGIRRGHRCRRPPFAAGRPPQHPKGKRSHYQDERRAEQGEVEDRPSIPHPHYHTTMPIPRRTEHAARQMIHT